MTFLYPEQLQRKLTKKSYNYYYILFGNNEFLLNDTKNFILKYIQSICSCEYLNFLINNKLTKEKIIEACQKRNLFNYKKRIFLLTILNEKSNFYILKKLSLFIDLLCQDSILVLHMYKLSVSLKNVLYSKENIKKRILFIDCNTPEYIRLKSWILTRAKNLQITLNEPSCNLLCSHYEHDLNGLNQILNQLSIVYSQKNLCIQDIKKFINDTLPHFHLSNLLDSILIGDNQKSNYILEKLKIENTILPLTILHTIQYTISLLIILKRQLLYNDATFVSLFNKYKIPKNRHLLFIKAMQRLTIEQLYKIVTLLLQTELIIHKKYFNNIWNNFSLLVLLLCNNISDNTISYKNNN